MNTTHAMIVSLSEEDKKKVRTETQAQEQKKRQQEHQAISAFEHSQPAGSS